MTGEPTEEFNLIVDKNAFDIDAESDELKLKNNSTIYLKNGVNLNSKLKRELEEYCEKNLAKYMIPKEFVFRESLPKTLVGKINYRELENI